jgi:hypothetical protein
MNNLPFSLGKSTDLVTSPSTTESILNTIPFGQIIKLGFNVIHAISLNLKSNQEELFVPTEAERSLSILNNKMMRIKVDSLDRRLINL